MNIETRVDVSGGVGNYSYLWNSGQTENPIDINLNPGIYSVKITDENMCSIDTSFRIKKFTEDCIPNVFSPNGDDVNDVWPLEDAFLFLIQKLEFIIGMVNYCLSQLDMTILGMERIHLVMMLMMDIFLCY